MRVDGAGDAAALGHAGLHVQAVLEHHDVGDVHAQGGAGAFGAVDRVVDHVRGVGTLLGHQQHAVLPHLAEADRAHHQPADEAAFDVQAVVGLLVDVRGVHHVGVEHQVVDCEASSRAAGVASPAWPPMAQSTPVGISITALKALVRSHVRRRKSNTLDGSSFEPVGGAVDGFHLAGVAQAVLADQGDADRARPCDRTLR